MRDEARHDPADGLPPRPRETRTAWSCVADADPVIQRQLLLWLHCLSRTGLIPAADIFVHLTPHPFTGLRRWLADLGVNVIDIAPFGVSPSCNKLRQLETFAHSGYRRVVLMDCDTAYAGAELPAGTSPVMAKIVDAASPPERMLAAVFKAAGLGEPCWVGVTFPGAVGHRLTDRNNCNGGVYILDTDVLLMLAPEWMRWARWCGEQGVLFGAWRGFADQAALALACRGLGVEIQLLPIEWNFPTLARGEKFNVTPSVLHYHRFTTPDGRLKPTGLSKPDAAIEKVNGYLRELPSLQELDRLSG